MKNRTNPEPSIKTTAFGLIAAALLFAGCSGAPIEPAAAVPPAKAKETDITKQCRALGRGLNMANALEGPTEGSWGVTIGDDYFELIREQHFDSVRIPIRWSAHADSKPPYTIVKAFTDRIDEVVNQALAEDLRVVINMHHYEELIKEPQAHRDRFLAIWGQIAAHYQNYPASLSFEILNEPTGLLSAELWNEYLAAAIKVIRETNPNRPIIVGIAEWGGLKALNKLVLPDDDRNLIVTYHYYEPFNFTHQGAPWVGGSTPWLGTTWLGTEKQQQDVLEAFDDAAQWAETHNRPLYMGEFGAYREADERSRELWTEFVAREAEKRGIPWSYWEFCAGFGVYDPESRTWRTTLLKALVPPKEQAAGSNS